MVLGVNFGIKGGKPNPDTFIKWILFILFIIVICFHFCSCRTVQKSLQVEKKSLDSTTVLKKETTEQTINWNEVFKASNVDVKINFDTAKKTTTQEKDSSHYSIATDFITHLVELANKPISSIEISANNVSDSVHNNVQSSAIKTTDSTHVKETVKNKDEKKESKSNTVLLIIAGISLIAIVYGAYVKSTADKAVKTPEEIYNTIKAQEINKIIK